MACIVKQRPDSSFKTRLVIDLRRSGANAQCRVPERIVLPRPSDVVEAAATLYRRADELVAVQHELGHSTDDWGLEFLGTDMADAYFHFRAAPEEWKHLFTKALT
eukprot:6041599-Amphidinium_carterae.1